MAIKKLVFFSHFKKIFAVVAFGVAISVVLVGCPDSKNKSPESPQTKSRDLLAEGLAAQNSGDDALAEVKLQNALVLDPSNERAITALASLYAGRAGVVLTQLVDPILQASDALNSPTSKLLEETRKLRAAEIETKYKNEGKEKRSEEVILEAQKIVNELSLAISHISLTFVILNTIPIMKEENLPSLEKAIGLLRQGSVVSSGRSEESRIYLAILSSVRLITQARILIGNSPFSLSELRVFQDGLCKLGAPELKASILTIKASLELLEEGLTPSKSDPETSKRKKRKKMLEFVTKVLGNKVFEETESFFEKNSELSKLSNRLGVLWCTEAKNGQ